MDTDEFVEIKEFDNYEINRLGNIRNKSTANRLIPFYDKTTNKFCVDLYKQEGKTIVNKSGETIAVQTKYRREIVTVVIKQFHFCDGIEPNNFIIKYVDKNRMNCEFKNIKIVSKLFIYNNNGNGTFDLYNCFDKVFQQSIKSLPKNINKFHLFKGYSNDEASFIQFYEDLKVWNSQLHTNSCA